MYGGGGGGGGDNHNKKDSSNRKKKPAYHEVRAKAQHNLRVFATVLRAAARMRVDASRWAEHEKTRLRLVRAVEESRRAVAAEEEQALVA